MVSITLLGPPGVGKGTQGEILTRELGFEKVSTGDILRENVSRKTELGKKAEGYMDRGSLVPDELVIDMMSAALASGENFILDGFPRNLVQAKSVEVDLAILFEVRDDVVVERLSLRRVCPECHALYHLRYKKPKIGGKCDRCGSELIQRTDDVLEVIGDRLNVYKREMKDVIALYDGQGKLIRVNGEGSAKEISDELMRVLKGYTFFDHTADVGIDAWGYSMQEMLRQSGLAVSKLMAPGDGIEEKEEEIIEVKGTKEELLVNLLSELLYLRDAKGFVAGSFDVAVEDGGEGLKARAVVCGEEYDREKHGYGHEIKAVTYHMLSVKKDMVYRARVILDI